MAGDNGYLAHFDGLGWTELPIAGCTNTINDAFVDSWNGENIWVGYAGTHRGIYFSDGSQVEMSTNLTVNGLACAGPVRAGSFVCTWADLGGPGRPAPDDTTERFYRVVITGE